MKVSGRVAETAPIERVGIFRRLDHIRMASPYDPEPFEGSKRYRIAWASSPVRGRDRLSRRDQDDGARAWTSRVSLDAEPRIFR